MRLPGTFFTTLLLAVDAALLTAAAALRAVSPSAHSLVVWSSIAASAASDMIDRMPPIAEASELYASLVATTRPLVDNRLKRNLPVVLRDQRISRSGINENRG